MAVLDADTIVKEIKSKDGLLLAIVAYNEKPESQTVFYTCDPQLPMQVGRIVKTEGESVKQHKHRHTVKTVIGTTEVLYIEKGSANVNIYDEKGEFVAQELLTRGDIIVLFLGSHSLMFKETTKMIEIKQGPYDPNEKEFVK